MEHHRNYLLKNLIHLHKGIYYLEEWRPVVGRERHYLISSFGRVKSIKSNCILKQYINEKGYATISLGYGAPRKMKVHRLVASAFWSNPQNKPEVNHDDFVKTNNFYKNLSWATGKENTNHAQEGGKRPIRKPKPIPEERPVKHKKVIDTQTGFVFDSVKHLASLLGGIEKEWRRKLSGESKNNTQYRYLDGQYTILYEKKTERDLARLKELRPVIFGCAV